MSNPTQNVTSILATFDPHDHLIAVKTIDGPKAHYPFCWRLHEFRLRYPQGLIQAEIVHLDVERDLVIVRVTACTDGLEAGKGVGLQTGSLTLLDQVTQRAKAHALMDLGIGCGWPVLFPDELDTIEIVPLDKQSSAQIHERQKQAQGSGHTSAPTVSSVRELFIRAYQVKPTELETRWQKFKKHFIKQEIADEQLSESQLRALHTIATQQYERMTTDKLFAAPASKNGSK